MIIWVVYEFFDFCLSYFFYVKTSVVRYLIIRCLVLVERRSSFLVEPFICMASYHLVVLCCELWCLICILAFWLVLYTRGLMFLCAFVKSVFMSLFASNVAVCFCGIRSSSLHSWYLFVCLRCSFFFKIRSIYKRWLCVFRLVFNLLSLGLCLRT